jgi:endo-beta-N-acetylglucosaminidase D
MTTFILSSNTSITCSVDSPCRAHNVYVSAKFTCTTTANDDKELMLLYCGPKLIEEVSEIKTLEYTSYGTSTPITIERTILSNDDILYLPLRVCYQSLNSCEIVHAYSFFIASTTDDDILYPKHWTLEARRNNGSWRVIDDRNYTTKPSDMVSVLYPIVSSFLSASFDEYRLSIRDVFGSIGGTSKYIKKQKIKLSMKIWTSNTLSVSSFTWGWQLSLFGSAGQRRLRFYSSDGLFDIIAQDSFPPASWEKSISVNVCKRDDNTISVQVAVDRVFQYFTHMDSIRNQVSDVSYSNCIVLSVLGIFKIADEIVVIGSNSLTHKSALDEPNDQQHVEGFTGSITNIILSPSQDELHDVSSTLYLDSEISLRSRISPLRTLEQVLLWKPNPSTDALLVKSVPLKVRFSHGLVSKSGPLSLLCHDCGPAVYIEDADIGQSKTFFKSSIKSEDLPKDTAFGHTYRIENFSGCDIFVYFSHNRVTIPPLSWINACHTNGTRILGTIITEWKDGEAANELLLRAYEDKDKNTTLNRTCTLAYKLANIAKYYGFDGWLINIEAPLTVVGSEEESVLTEISKLCTFLKDLTEQVHSVIGDQGLVIWYDSIDSKTGSVHWQSELNASNQIFLEQCDGIFLDYHWNESKIQQTATLAKSLGRSRDVFLGADIWGRGSFGGEGFRGARIAARVVKDTSASIIDNTSPLSFALFGPAWSYESQGGSKSIERFRTLEEKLWWGCDANSEDSTPQLIMDIDKISLPVLNPSGIPLLSSQIVALGGSSLQAISLIGLAGWKIDESGGSGWSVETDDKSMSSFVTSYEWCRSSQLVPLPPSFFDFSLVDICIEEEYCGTGPNIQDLYQLRVAVLDSSGLEIVSWDSGELICSNTWQITRTFFQKVDKSAHSIHIQHGGCDAEHWVGHFGSRMRNLKVTLITPRTLHSSTVESMDRLIDLVGGPRPVTSSLPFQTTFNCGAGAAIFKNGYATEWIPWADYSTCSVLPTWIGISSSVLLDEFQLVTSLIHSTAWDGGTSLLISQNASTLFSSSSHVPVKGKVRLFKLDIPVDCYEKLEVRLIYKKLSSHTCDLTPDFVFRDDTVSISMEHISTELIGDMWSSSTFVCSIGDVATHISELQLALQVSHFSETRLDENEILKIAIGKISVKR